MKGQVSNMGSKSAKAAKGQKKAFYHAVKRLFDIAVSLPALIITLPIIILLAAAVRIESKGSPIYVHGRVGKNGKPFKMFKLRSMYLSDKSLEELLTPEMLEYYKREYKLPDDPRITKVGRFIRKTSLDELPQLVNILLGHMSIVGPRPLVEEELENYGDKRAELLSVRPGLTGYWQAYARNNVSYQNGERQQMELFYVRNRSFAFDLKIIFKTVEAVIRKNGC